MKFRPCIDIHNGEIKQIVGGSLNDLGNQAAENFVSTKNAAFYADLYKQDGLSGGHIILLNSIDSEYYALDRAQAVMALHAYPYGLQIGGGICAENAGEYIKEGASHVIVTSYIFKNGELGLDNLKKLVEAVGKEHIVLDVSCRRKEETYYVVTDRWQTYTKLCLTESMLEELSEYCDEFLIHGVDMEGKKAGMEEGAVKILSSYAKKNGSIPVTYAGGLASMENLERFAEISGGNIDFTVGSALDIFGGDLPYKKLVAMAEKGFLEIS